MEAKHSPAPFRWQNGTLVDARGMGVAKMVPNVYPEQEAQFDADRALLAAAPAMLAALDGLVDELRGMEASGDFPTGYDVEGSIANARTALRLARGA